MCIYNKKGEKRCQKWQDYQNYLILTSKQVWSINKNIERGGRGERRKGGRDGGRKKENKEKAIYISLDKATCHLGWMPIKEVGKIQLNLKIL